MRPKKKSLLLFVGLSIIVIACYSNKPEFGYSLIKENTEALYEQKVKNEIRNISNEVFESDSFINSQNNEIKYRLLKPRNHVNKTNQKYPLVVIFHGSGAIGKDNEKQLGLLAKLWALPKIYKKYPAFILVPQFSSRSSNYSMDLKRDVLVSTPQSNLNLALGLIDSLTNHLNIDKKRIYAI